ncbi:Gp15 family bacteriophage protein [Lactococcus lactis]|uniref:Gp15 family bacteriophage protein n=1 Tax=Lactococcus lactis TaxID=1358 RepID=UPI0004947D35|nr:Gp15 family bacteriophage protein [Lactococcus lactis]
MVLSLSWSQPDVIEAKTADYEVVMDFSRVLRLFELYKQDDIDVSEKLFITVEMFFLAPINEIPEEDFQLILEGLTQKIIGDNSREETVERDMKGNILEEEKKFYDFEEDADYIFASFMQDYGIDLIKEREKSNYYWNKVQSGKMPLEKFRNHTMSWDKFNALLTGLSETSKFRRVIEIRQMEIPENATEKERKEIKKAKSAVALKSDREKIEFEMMDLKEQREFMRRKEEELNGQ